MGTKRTFSIHFWLNQSKKYGDLAPIYARITVDGRRCEISLKRQTSVTFWDTKSKKTTSRTPEGKVLKDGSDTKNTKFYVPKKVVISNPKVEKEQAVMPYCFAEDFVLEWNADPKNEEGLMVVAEFFGATGIPFEEEFPTIINVDFIDDDNGKTVLNNDLFKGMPNTGIVYLSLLRGNVEIEEVNGELVKVYAETHAEFPFVLIQDLDIIKN